MTDYANLVEYIGLIVSISCVLLPIAFWFYKKRPSIKVMIKRLNNGVSISVRNKKDVHIKINHIVLVNGPRFRGALEFDRNSYFGLIDSDEYGFQTTQNDDLGISLEPNGPSVNLDISYSKISYLYAYFLPYKRCAVYGVEYLDKMVKMPKCYLAIILDSGGYKLIDLPSDFYRFYKNNISFELDREFSIFLGEHPKITQSFKSYECKLKYGSYLLERYSMMRRTYHYLL
ncbi:hypothetical protein [Aeromonas veronii]|uniref:hypothetical protein n=1 Tax=Aeromonas veronii TaxID=654 RepID=UPI003B9E84A2